MKNSLIIILVSLLSLGSCNKRPEGVLSESEMEELLTDLELADAYYLSSPSGSDKAALTEAVLKKHGVSQEELDSTIAYYGRNIDEYYALYEKVEKRLQKKSGHAEEPSEEDDIWPYSRFAAYMPGQMSDGITFSIPAEDLAPGNSIDWRMRLSSAVNADIMLGVEYENGVTMIVKKNGQGGQPLQLNLITDTALVAKRIFGTMSIPTASRPIWADSIRLIKLEYDSLEYPRIRSQKKIYRSLPKPAVEEIPDTVTND